MTYRDEALERLDVAAYWQRHGVKLLGRVGPNEVRFKCPFHDDAEASANVNTSTGLWNCHAGCGGGSPIDFAMKKMGVDYKDALTDIGTFAGLGPPSLAKRPNGGGPAAPSAAVTRKVAGATKVTEENVEAWHAALGRNKEVMRWFAEHRGYTQETIDQRQLGWDGQRITIPIRNDAGKLLNVRRYARDAKGEQGKMIWLASGARSVLFPLALPLPEDVILVEGEWDAMLMHQHGFTNTLTVTSGAGVWEPTFTDHFAGRNVTICYDNDDAGRKGGIRVASILSNVAKVTILQIPNLPPKGDVTDFFVEQNRTPDELRDLIADASPYVATPLLADDDTEAVAVPLNLASDAKHRGKKLELPILLSGKAMTPYTVPYEFNVHCDMSNKRFCGVCPMQTVSGNRDVKLRASDPAVLSLVNVSAAAQYNAIKELAQAIPSCNRPQVDIKSSINIEELRLIPELDNNTSEGEAEYVTRTGFFMGHGLLPNRSYKVVGYTHPSPKTQATVHLLSEAIPSQDNISAFAMTPELAKDLRIFQPEGSVEDRWRDIYDDFRQNVHRIQGRLDMQIAYDLAWHSVISFTFNGAFVRRGWVEAMVIGDSGQGKTEMVMELLRHYRLGERVQGEQTSTAGIMGGLEKMGDTWMLSWGRIPLNDKRLLIIDEAQGLHPSTIEGLSDVRATGVAEITKIRTERTNARCRLIWLANPINGLTLAQHNQGVLAIKDLFKKPEDIRRLDFAITASSSDVDFERSINIRHDAAGKPRYSSDVSRALVLWAWSRRADQITFTSEATDAILRAATRMGRRYHASIPLVEPSDQRLKLARLAASAAARVYSTDETGERLVVRPEHVAFVEAFLTRVYGSPSMAYDEYSESMRRGESLDDGEEREVTDTINGWEGGASAISFFRQAHVFRKSDLTDGLGWDESYAKDQIKMLLSKRLIKQTRTGYYKSPAFIALLRTLANGDIDVPEEGAPF